MMVFTYFLLFIAFYSITKHILHKIKNLPPSPFPSLPVIGHLYLLKKPLHLTLTKLGHRYGPVILLQFGSRRVLHVSSTSAAEDCLTTNDIVFANRPRLLAGKHIGYNYTSLAWSPYGDHWRNLRRIASLEILSSHRLQMLSTIRSDEVKLLISRISKLGDKPVDVKTSFFELMLNVMMRMIAGKRYFGENVEEVEEASRFREIVTETFRIGGATNIGEFLPFLRKLGFKGVEKKMIELQAKRDGFMQNLIEQHRKEMISEEEEGKRKTLIQVLLNLRETEPETYKDETIKSLMLVLLAAGTDTSAGTMEWAMSLLLNHPEVLQKAQKELDEIVGHGRLVNESDLSKLSYLHCIINETLRMKPVGPLLVPHESSEECSVGGYRIPAGTMLLVNLYAIQNDPKVWPEANKFKPERFEGFEGVKDGFKLMPFGSGRRGCPGENLALKMIGLTLGSLLQCFEWERISEELVDLSEGTGLTMPKALPLLAKCRPRLDIGNLLLQN